MTAIFVSYRRSDTGPLAGRICDRLRTQFGNDSVFYDVASIPLGIDFKEYITEALSKIDVLVAVIGPNWVGSTKRSNLLSFTRKLERRIDDASDIVRIEVETALQLGVPVIPVYAENTKMLSRKTLPNSLMGLADRNAVNVQDGIHFDGQVATLIKSIDYHIGEKKAIGAGKRLDPENKDFKILPVADSADIEKLLSETIQIDRQYYMDDFVGILQKCISWYEANPEIYTFATDLDGKVIGAVNAMPIEQGIYDSIAGGDFLDNDIPPESIIQLFLPGEFDLYFCSIVVDKHYRNTAVFWALFDAFIEKMHRWHDDGFIVRRIVCDAVTRDGDKMCNLIGCEKEKKTNHNSWIYTLSMLPPRIKPTTPRVRALIGKYREYYAELS